MASGVYVLACFATFIDTLSIACDALHQLLNLEILSNLLEERRNVAIYQTDRILTVTEGYVDVRESMDGLETAAE